MNDRTLQTLERARQFWEEERARGDERLRKDLERLDSTQLVGRFLELSRRRAGLRQEVLAMEERIHTLSEHRMLARMELDWLDQCQRKYLDRAEALEEEKPE